MAKTKTLPESGPLAEVIGATMRDLANGDVFEKAQSGSIHFLYSESDGGWYAEVRNRETGSVIRRSPAFLRKHHAEEYVMDWRND